MLLFSKAYLKYVAIRNMCVDDRMNDVGTAHA